jgi:predicted DNA-binding transcriptional regulator YafY
VNRTDRLMGIILELQARGELRAEDLADTFEVSVRTVYRDIDALGETGVPIVATPGKGYRLLEGYFLPPVSFTADEAALLILGGELVRDRVDPALRQAAEDALRKLASVLPPDRRDAMEHRRQRLVFPTLASVGRQSDDKRLALARRAIDERRVVRMLYHALHRAAPEPRDIEPMRLVFLADAWHLVGWCRLRQGARIFRLDRIDRLDERYTPGPRHELQAHDERSPEQYPEARVRFDRRVLRWVRERQPWALLREERDARGPVFVYAVRTQEELLGWLLRWGSAVEVLEPAWLRERLAEEARAILVRHAAPEAEPVGALLTPVPAT